MSWNYSSPEFSHQVDVWLAERYGNAAIPKPDEVALSREWGQDNEKLLGALVENIANIDMPGMVNIIKDGLNRLPDYRPEQLGERTFSWLPDDSTETREAAQNGTMLRAVHGTGFILAERGWEADDRLYKHHEALVLLLGLAVEDRGALTFRRVFLATDQTDEHAFLYRRLTGGIWEELQTERAKRHEENGRTITAIAIERFHAEFADNPDKLVATPEKESEWRMRTGAYITEQARINQAYRDGLVAIGPNPINQSKWCHETDEVVNKMVNPQPAYEFDYRPLLRPLVDSNVAADAGDVAHNLNEFLAQSSVVASLLR